MDLDSGLATRPGGTRALGPLPGMGGGPSVPAPGSWEGEAEGVVLPSSLWGCQAAFHGVTEIVPPRLSLHKQMKDSELPAFGGTQLAYFYKEK